MRLIFLIFQFLNIILRSSNFISMTSRQRNHKKHRKHTIFKSKISKGCGASNYVMIKLFKLIQILLNNASLHKLSNNIRYSTAFCLYLAYKIQNKTHSVFLYLCISLLITSSSIQGNRHPCFFIATSFWKMVYNKTRITFQNRRSH